MPTEKTKTGFLYEDHELKAVEYKEEKPVEHSGNKIKRRKRRMVKEFFKRCKRFFKVAWKWLNQDIK